MRRTHPGATQFGLPIALVTGPAARQAVEEAVVRAFPCGENYRASPPQHQILPLAGLRYESPEEMTARYGRVMEARQRVISGPKRRGKRNYRRATDWSLGSRSRSGGGMTRIFKID
jgi:hypothetical protein